MGGLSLGLGGGIRLGGSLGNQPPATIAQTAYGAQQSATDGTRGMMPWHLAVLVPTLAVGWLAFLRWSLPR